MSLSGALAGLVKAAKVWRDDPDSDKFTLKLIYAIDHYVDTRTVETYRMRCHHCGVTGQAHTGQTHEFVAEVVL